MAYKHLPVTVATLVGYLGSAIKGNFLEVDYEGKLPLL